MVWSLTVSSMVSTNTLTPGSLLQGGKWGSDTGRKHQEGGVIRLLWTLGNLVSKCPPCGATQRTGQPRKARARNYLL